MRRDHWLREIEKLDPETDFRRIYVIMYAHEFPWDLNQALGFALYRTYAVPTIGSLLLRTGEFTGRPQKRYDDTGLILETMLLDGLDGVEGRAALRRMNQMHAGYDISNDDLRYVLATFVTTPIRWFAAHGWRELSETEKVASANYYRNLGRHMGIRDIPATYQQFGDLLDAYEREHFAYSDGGRAVSDATLALMRTFPPSNLMPAAIVRRFALSLMDGALLDAFDYPHPSRIERAVADLALQARGAFLRRRPPRMQPRYFRDLPQVRSYPDGYDVTAIGTFPNACPVPHAG